MSQLIVCKIDLVKSIGPSVLKPAASSRLPPEPPTIINNNVEEKPAPDKRSTSSSTLFLVNTKRPEDEKVQLIILSFLLTYY